MLEDRRIEYIAFNVADPQCVCTMVTVVACQSFHYRSHASASYLVYKLVQLYYFLSRYTVRTLLKKVLCQGLIEPSKLTTKLLGFPLVAVSADFESFGTSRATYLSSQFVLWLLQLFIAIQFKLAPL